MNRRNALLLAAIISICWIASTLSQDVGKSSVTQNLDLPYNAGTGDSTEEDAAEVIFFYGQQYEGDAFVFCVDRSGSMLDRGELDRAKREIARNIMEFNSATEFAVCFFSERVLMWPSSGATVPASYNMKRAACAWIAGVDRGVYSCPKKGLARSIQAVNRSRNDRRCIIYVGDGGGTCLVPGWKRSIDQGDNPHGYSSAVVLFEMQYLQGTLAEVERLNYKNVSINSVGVMMAGRREVHHQFVENLARNNNGTYRRID